MQDGDLVALIRTVGGIGALQQFTTDKRLLRAAVENIKFYPQLGGWDIFGSSPTPEEEKLQSFRNEYYSFGAFYSLAYVIAGLNRVCQSFVGRDQYDSGRRCGIARRYGG